MRSRLIRLLLVMPIFGATLAQAETPTLEQLIDRLAHPEYRVRCDATRDLMLREDLDEAHMQSALRSAAYPERVQRMERVAMHRFFAAVVPDGPIADAERGALGVSFPDVQFAADRYVVRAHQHPLLPSPAILITHTYPGFPAFVHLQPGDLVYAINGESFGADLNNQVFGDRVKDFKAGDAVRMDIVRDDRKLSIELKLGSLARLESVSNLMRRMGGITPDLYVPWRIKLRELRGDEDDVSVIRLANPKRGLVE